MIRTAQSVATAVDLVFGDQILRWDHYKERFLKHGEIPVKMYFIDLEKN